MVFFSRTDVHQGLFLRACFTWAVMLLVCMITMQPNALASHLIPQQSHYYYKIGGNSDITIPPVRRTTKLTIGGSTHNNLGYTCDGYNPAVSINNTLNNFEKSLYGLTDSIVGSATALMVGASWYALEKADPDAYNFLQNQFASAGDTFNIGLKSCQDNRKLVQQGKSPYTEFMTISDSKGWINSSRQAASGQDQDPVTVRTTTAQQQGQNGMAWMHNGESAGGKNQKPIKLISDVSTAGYNIVDDPKRVLDSNDVPTGDAANMLRRYWDRPDDAGKWSTLVLGDITITAKQSDDAQSTLGGTGLAPLLTTCPKVGHSEHTCIQTLQDKLWNIVNSDSIAKPDDLRAVSATNLTMTQDIIESVRNQEPEEQALSVQKLAEEVAIQNLVEEALALKRLLAVGMQAQPVQVAHTMQQGVQEAINHLDLDIKDLAFDHNIRQQMMGNTLQTILGEQGKLSVNAQASIHDESTLPLDHGAVYMGKGDRSGR